MQFGHAHIASFLKGLTSRSAAPCTFTIACKSSTSDLRECANCGVGAGDRSDLLLKACSRCKLVFYCGEPCQRQHWKKGEHKRFCVPFGDRKPTKGDADSVMMKPIETKPSYRIQPVGDTASTKQCTICLEPLIQSTTQALVCGHVFHDDCMAGVQSFGISQKCPLCRSGLSNVGSK